jgi:hypothetical protein
MRAYERDERGDGWHDALLMELLAGEQPSETTQRDRRTGT